MLASKSSQNSYFNGRLSKFRDLVHRHEKSFHPLADKINTAPTDREINAVDDQIILTPPNPASPDCSSTQNLAMALGPSLGTEAALPQQNSSQLSLGGGHSVTSTVLSPPQSDLSSLENENSASSMNDEVLLLDPVVVSSINRRESSMTDKTESRTANTSTSIADQLGVDTNSTINVQQSISNLQAWHSSDMIWPDLDQHGDGEIVPQSNGCQTSSMPPGSHHDDYLNNIDILSMMPKNGVNFDEDFSTYLLHAGISPSEPTDLPNDIHEHSTLQQTSFSESIDSYPAMIEAKAASFNFHRERGSGTFSRMPNIMKETPRKLPVPVVDPESYERIVTDTKSRLSVEQFEENEMLSSQDMQRFLTSYFTCFHCHCPIIHIPSMDLRSVPSHLILAICALGALYRLSRKTAKQLWYWAELMTKNVRQSNGYRLSMHI